MERMNVKLRGLLLTFAIITLTIVSGCNDNQVTNPETVTPTTNDNGELSLMSASGDHPDSFLILDSVKIMLKDIKLDPADSHGHECDFRTGPFVVKLNLNSSVNVFTTAMIPAGSYDRIKFEIHKLNPNVVPPDPDFGMGSERFTIVAWGSYNGVPFAFQSKKSVNQSIHFDPPAVMSELPEIKANITLTVDPYAWFYDNGHFLNPGVENNDDKIDNNIRSSFRAFCDNDHNGIPDGH
jgi:hypothetical protein